MSAREVIRREIARASVNCATVGATTDAILAALRAAPEEVRLALARDLAPEGWVVVPREMTDKEWARIERKCGAKPWSLWAAHARELWAEVVLAAAPGAGEAE